MPRVAGPVWPNGLGEWSPGLRPQADALGQQAPAALRPGRPREPEPRVEPAPAETLATFQAAVICRLLTQGIGLRPQPWAGICRPVGPVEKTEDWAAVSDSLRFYFCNNQVNCQTVVARSSLLL
jgi:hypothetical protein